ncbi:MAG: hypothetical protein WC538_21000 [Thermoanaerobaculia bacterium]|jgi:hypothetical protein
MSAPIILGIAVTRHQVGLVVLTVERLERHEIIGLDGDAPLERLDAKVRQIVSAHGPNRAALTCPRARESTPIVAAVRERLGPLLGLTVRHDELVAQARRTDQPPTNRARARAYTQRYPDLRSRIPALPPLRAIRTAFERHHEVLFRALLLADLTLIASLTPELPLL